METYTVAANGTMVLETLPSSEPVMSTSLPFITANTKAATLEEIQEFHTIPNFAKDNESLISHAAFIGEIQAAVQERYAGQTILQPNIRLSHLNNGRIPSAMHKPADQLLPHEKTMWYERMAFIIELPSIQQRVGEHIHSLTVGGIKNYDDDNLGGKKSEQQFNIFVGFKNHVCTNMNIWTDGAKANFKVSTLDQLREYVKSLLAGYNDQAHLQLLNDLPNYKISENQFAQLIGRCRMYQHLSAKGKKDIPTLLLNDGQINNVCEQYYKSPDFSRDTNGDISLYRLLNLFTGAVKNSYVHGYLPNSVNAGQFINGIKNAVQGNADSWYLQN